LQLMVPCIFKNKFFPVAVSFSLPKKRESAKNVLVISPHPDDDVIGMGGQMKLLSDAGFNVYAVYLTGGPSRGIGRKPVAEVRQQEALAALKVVGAKAGIFLGHQSRNLEKNRVVNDIQAVVDWFLPKSIYVPSVLERHSSHLRGTAQTVRAVRRIRGYGPDLWGYSVWSSCFSGKPFRTIDISAVIRTKKKAIEKHQSQLAVKDYASGIIGRNRYEGIFLKTHGRKYFAYGETFVNMTDLARNRRLRLKGFTRRISGF